MLALCLELSCMSDYVSAWPASSCVTRKKFLHRLNPIIQHRLYSTIMIQHRLYPTIIMQHRLYPTIMIQHFLSHFRNNTTASQHFSARAGRRWIHSGCLTLLAKSTLTKSDHFSMQITQLLPGCTGMSAVQQCVCSVCVPSIQGSRPVSTCSYYASYDCM